MENLRRHKFKYCKSNNTHTQKIVKRKREYYCIQAAFVATIQMTYESHMEITNQWIVILGRFNFATCAAGCRLPRGSFVCVYKCAAPVKGKRRYAPPLPPPRRVAAGSCAHAALFMFTRSAT